jgi:hypothetical protein
MTNLDQETEAALDAFGIEAAIELDSIAFERWEQERREAEQENEDESNLNF